MAIDKSVDSSLLDAAMSYEAGKIRAKLGSSAQINYDLANGKGFGDAIDAIPTGGGSNERLLASGTHTVTAVTSSATISTSVTNSDETKPIKVLVVKDSTTSGVGQMLWWASVYPVGPDAFVNQAGSDFAKGKYIAATGTSTGIAPSTSNSANGSIICEFSRSAGKITLRIYSNNYKIQPDTYHWYVWGEEASA